MARHRNVRNMNFDDDYEGYNDVYGHSVEDNYCVSPSASQYLYNRGETSQISAFFSPKGDDIQEEPEDDVKRALDSTRERLQSLTLETAVADLLPEEEILLKSCLEEIQNVMGDSMPDAVIISQILQSKFNMEKALDACLRGATELQSQPQTAAQKFPTIRQEDRVSAVGLGRGAVIEEKRADQRDDRLSKIAAVDSGGRGRRNKLEPVKIVPASKGSVTVGFELPHKETFRDTRSEKDNLSVYSSDSKNSSKAPSPVPPEENKKEEPSRPTKSKEFKGDLAINEYTKQRGTGKDLLNLLVIGHVDAGKSTLMGHLLWQLGQVPKKTMHKFEQESKKLGKQSFVYAWVLDETGEERSRGITMDVGQSKFETDTKSVVLLDAPGHKDFIPNMISGASQADVAVLVVDSTTGEFETGFELGGQTREHTLLSRSLGVGQLIIAVNKLDTVNWSQDRFDEIKVKLTTFLKQAGYRDNDITFVPCSGLIGQNLIKKCTEPQLNDWYTGPTLLQAIDTLRPPERPVGKPLRLSVNDIFKGAGGLCIAGRVETGMVQAGDKVLVQPIGEIATVKSITVEESAGSIAFAGDPILLNLQNLSDTSAICVGCVLSDPNYPCRVSTKFQARIVTFDAMSIPLVKGFTGVMHLGSLAEQVVVKRLVSVLRKGAGEVPNLKPRCFVKNCNGLVNLETAKPICLEEFKDVKELGRFTLRSAGVTIAAGVITQVL